jgi:hypothetical protein
MTYICRSKMRRGDVAWVDWHGQHPAIIIDPTNPLAIVAIYGTGTFREGRPSCRVEPATRFGKALDLSKVTYLYAENAIVVVATKLRLVGRPCPPGLMLALDELLRNMAPRTS